MPDGTPGATGRNPQNVPSSLEPFDFRDDPMFWKRRKTCTHVTSQPYVIVKKNGTRAVVELCVRCYSNMHGAGIFLPNERYDLDDLPVIADNRSGSQPCARCGMWETELHHWAPVHLFDDANSWPTDYLCKTCHAFWHRQIVFHFRAEAS